jgi:hypothetical protein
MIRGMSGKWTLRHPPGTYFGCSVFHFMFERSAFTFLLEHQ